MPPVRHNTLDLFDRFGFERKFIENESTLLWSKLAFLARDPAPASVDRSAEAPAGREAPADRERELLIASIDELTPEDRRHVAALVESLRNRTAAPREGH